MVPAHVSSPTGATRKLLIALDFGTTMTAIAWCQTARPENPSIIVQFPDADGSMEGASSEEVPTELAYTSDGADYKWGFQATGADDRFVCFKLGLNPLREREASYLSIMYPDHTGLPPNDDHPAPDLSRDYIKKVRQHVIKILESKLGDVVVNTTPIEWIFTVPAIWEDGAKANTKSCAVAAGIREKIHMISEPEAAMTYVLDTMDPDTLQVGDTFVCADCGGGTVDLISYTIEDLGAKVKIIEAAEGTGDLCGSSFVNRVFRKWFTDRFSGHEGYGEDTLEAAMERFETITKRRFSGGPENFILPVPGLVDDPIKRVRRQRLTMTSADLTAIFEVVVPVVTSLVTTQIKKTAKPIKAVLMVGGFGQSPYLREMIKKVVGPKVTVIQPANASTAVVRGALTTALAITTPGSSRIEVLSRVARKCYGIEWEVLFNHKKDLRSRRFWDPFEGKYYISEVNWLVKEGDITTQSKPFVLPLRAQNLVSEGPFELIEIPIIAFDGADGRSPPRHPDDGPRTFATLSADLSRIPTAQLDKRLGADGKEYYDIGYEIRGVFYSAHTEHSLWYKDQRYGEVDAKYE